MWWFLYNIWMSYFLISVSYLRRLVASELQGAHYSALSKISFKFSMDKSSKESLNHCWTSPCYPYPKIFFWGSYHFYRCDSRLSQNGKVVSCFIINPLLPWVWTLLELALCAYLEWTPLTWHLRIFFKPSNRVSPLMEEPECLILIHYFRGPCMLTSPGISGLVSFASQYQVWSQQEALNLVRGAFW